MAAEYVDDVPYVRHFIEELSPTRLRLVAALNGVTPPPVVDFDYCELGCAHGDTLAALAAAHPEGRFLGVDLSAAHVASAKRLARDGALENVGVLERDFGALVHEDVGEFDSIQFRAAVNPRSPGNPPGVSQDMTVTLDDGTTRASTVVSAASASGILYYPPGSFYPHLMLNSIRIPPGWGRTTKIDSLDRSATTRTMAGFLARNWPIRTPLKSGDCAAKLFLPSDWCAPSKSTTKRRGAFN